MKPVDLGPVVKKMEGAGAFLEAYGEQRNPGWSERAREPRAAALKLWDAQRKHPECL